MMSLCSPPQRFHDHPTNNARLHLPPCTVLPPPLVTAAKDFGCIHHLHPTKQNTGGIGRSHHSGFGWQSLAILIDPRVDSHLGPAGCIWDSQSPLARTRVQPRADGQPEKLETGEAKQMGLFRPHLNLRQQGRHERVWRASSSKSTLSLPS